MPFTFSFLLRHALVLDVAVLSEKLVECETPFLVSIRVLSPWAPISTFLACLQWVHSEVLPRQEGGPWVQKIMIAVAIVI